jgi:hypothetical protein
VFVYRCAQLRGFPSGEGNIAVSNLPARALSAPGQNVTF